MTTGSSSILYSAAGSPTINVSGGTLNVYSEIRRDTTNNSGSFNYIQTGGTVTIDGNNPVVPASFQGYRAAFEVLNDGSSFAMAGGTLSIINGNINTIAPYDVDIEPGTSNVTGGTIHFGSSGSTTNRNFVSRHPSRYGISLLIQVPTQWQYRKCTIRHCWEA